MGTFTPRELNSQAEVGAGGDFMGINPFTALPFGMPADVLDQEGAMSSVAIPDNMRREEDGVTSGGPSFYSGRGVADYDLRDTTGPTNAVPSSNGSGELSPSRLGDPSHRPDLGARAPSYPPRHRRVPNRRVPKGIIGRFFDAVTQLSSDVEAIDDLLPTQSSAITSGEPARVSESAFKAKGATLISSGDMPTTTTNRDYQVAQQLVALPPPKPLTTPPSPEQVRDRQAKIEELALAEREAVNRADLLQQKLAEQERERVAEIKRSTVDTIEFLTNQELSRIGVFNETDLSLPFARSFAEIIVRRARAYAEMNAKIGEIDSLRLFTDLESAEKAGKTLLAAILDGNISGLSPTLRASIQAAVTDRTQSKGKFRRLPADSMQDIPNSEAWRIIANKQIMAARDCSRMAHQEMFYNITELSDGTVGHVHPKHQEKPPMLHDFDELVLTLRLRPEEYFKKNGVESGIYVPLAKKQTTDPIDKIIQRAGGPNSGNIVNVEGFGHGAFVALVNTNSFNSVDPAEDGGYLLFVHHPLVPGYESRETNNTRDAGRFIVTNGRPTSPTTAEDVIELSVNTWHLTPKGYAWAYDMFTGTIGSTFADPREPLREGHRLVVGDIRERLGLIAGIRGKQAEMNAHIGEVLTDVSRASANELRINSRTYLDGLVLGLPTGSTAARAGAIELPPPIALRDEGNNPGQLPKAPITTPNF